ncbi:MAG TPA: DUF4148 domain-containing protein [Burkholderiaceae bacterium]
MNAKLLFIATVAVSLASTLAMADEAPLTRTQVIAELNQAAANGTLPRPDYDDDRAQVARRVESHAAKSVVAQQRDAATPAGY